VSEDLARAKAAAVDETLGLIERGRPEVPLEEFVAAGGNDPAVSVRPETVTARQMVDRYLEAHANGSIEENSLATTGGHLNQFLVTVGERFRVRSITLLKLQEHVECLKRLGPTAWWKALRLWPAR
jgi:hypothetical protein